MKIQRPEYFDKVLTAANALQVIIDDGQVPKYLRQEVEELWESLMTVAALSSDSLLAKYGDWDVEFYFSSNDLRLTALAKNPKFETITVKFTLDGDVLGMAGCDELPPELAKIIQTYVPNE